MEDDTNVNETITEIVEELKRKNLLHLSSSKIKSLKNNFERPKRWQKVSEKGSVLFENDRKTVIFYIIYDLNMIKMHKNANSNRDLCPHCLWKSPNSAPA